MRMFKNDDTTLKPKGLVFILGLAGVIDTQARALAAELDKGGHIYSAYSALDSLSSSYSMFKYFFDVYFAGTTDEMHELMLSPAGIVGITLESLFLVGFSYYASKFDKVKEDNYKKWIADAWPFFRDVLKALKNAYKGWRSAVVALGLLGILDIKNLILPVGLVLGVVGAANRYLIRHFRESRKTMMGQNAKILAALARYTFLTEEGLDNFYKKHGTIQSQSDAARYLGFFSAAIGGLIDGLYLYVGVLTLTAFAPQLLAVMAALCVFYTLACIVTRVFEEYEFQQKLIITQTKCLLSIDTKLIQTAYAQLLVLEAKKNKTPEDLLLIAHYKENYCRLMTRFDERRQLLKQQSSTSVLSSILIGLKYGLYAYGALSSILFLTSAILTIAGVGFPPAVVAAVVFSGLAMILGFVGYTLWEHFKHTKKQNAVDERAYQRVLATKERLEQGAADALVSFAKLNEALKVGLSVAVAPVYFFQEWFEIIRSLFSGISKGQKFVDFAGNPLQEVGEDGHYHDTPVMYVLGGLSAFLFGMVLALRALARGLGRNSLDSNNEFTAVAAAPVNENDLVEVQARYEAAARSGAKKTKESGESSPPSKRTDSPRGTEPGSNFFSFFGSKDKSLRRSQSAKELPNPELEPNIALGLN